MSGTAAASGRGRGAAGTDHRAGRDPARRVALDVLLAVAARDAYANLLLPRLIAQRRLAGRDAGLATELTYGTLRGRGSYDAVLAICCDRDLGSLDPDNVHTPGLYVNAIFQGSKYEKRIERRTTRET